MNRAHKIRLYPTKEQEIQLLKTAGAVRYAYSWALQRWTQLYKEYKADTKEYAPTVYSICRAWTQERPEWSHQVASESQLSAIQNLGQAFNNFFRNRTKYPVFHKKGRKDRFYVKGKSAAYYGSCVKLPKIGRVKLSEKLHFEGKIMSYTVSHYAYVAASFFTVYI